MSDKEKLFDSILKYLLSTNYYYTIVDGIKETRFYSQRLKMLLNQLEKEMDRLQKNEGISEFYKIADQERYMHNLDVHEDFFKKLCEMPAGTIEKFMEDFTNGYVVSIDSGHIVKFDKYGFIPEGWKLCNGQNGTPNLLPERYIMKL